MGQRVRRVWFALSGGLLGTVTAFYCVCIVIGVGILGGVLPNSPGGGAAVSATYLVGFLTGSGATIAACPDDFDAHRRQLVTILALFLGGAIASPGELLTATQPLSPVGWPHVAVTVLTLAGGYLLGYRRSVWPRLRRRVPGV